MSSPAPVPQTSPRAGYAAHREEIDAAIARVLDHGRYILGDETHAFEREFAAFVGTAHAVGVASGTDALHLALRATDIGPGDEVIVVSHTAVATVAAIELAGATPVLADIDATSMTLDPAAFERAVTPATRAVIPVHLYGHPADMPSILSIARRHDIRVIEDCAQSHGAALGGRAVGTWGDLAAFSFYPTKNLGAIGDGGMVTTSDERLAARLRSLREYGWRERYVSAEAGMNTRLDELQAAILRVKLRYLDSDNARRCAIAERYDTAVTLIAASGADLRAAPRGAGVRHVYHQYVVRCEDRDGLAARLRDRGIGTLVHYPAPVHLQPAYAGRVRLAGTMAVSERAAREVLSLPMFPELADDDVRRVTAALDACARPPAGASAQDA